MTSTSPFDKTTTPGSVTLLPELLNAIAALKGHAPAQAVAAPLEEVCPLTVNAVQAEQQEEASEARKNAEAIKQNIGQPDDKGNIFAGQLKRLGQTFNIIAAPQNLMDGATIKEAQERLADTKNWFGYDGTNYDNAAAFFEALDASTYNQGWIIAPIEVLAGVDADGKKVKDADSLAALEKKSPGIFGNGTILSSTFRDASVGILNSDGSVEWKHNAFARGACHPVRLVPA